MVQQLDGRLDLPSRARSSDDTGFRFDIQGLRAVAVVVVILYHAAGLLPGGFAGVDVFFVISGFVITRSLVSEHRGAGRISVRDFYRRRVQRLTPALMVTLVVVMPLSVLFAPIAAVRTTIATGAAATVLAANIALAEGPGYFDLGAESNPLAHTWSLSLEEQFYLVFPLLVVALATLGARRATLRRTLRLGLLTAGVLSLVACLAASNADGEFLGIAWSRIAFFAMPLRAWQFIAGALVALAVQRAAAFRWQTFVGAIGVVLTLGSFVLLKEVPYPSAWALAPTIGAMLILATPAGAPARVLRWRPLVRAGDVSYSWYLWHWPPMVFARVGGVESRLTLAAIGLATYPLAVLSYRQVEQRFRSTPSTPPRRWLQIAVVGVAAGLLVAGASYAAFDRIISTRVTVTETSGAGRSELTVECTSVAISDSMSACTFGEGTRRVGLVGDSNAAQFTSTMVGAARSLDATVTVVTENGCPVVDVVVVKFGTVDPACRARVAAALSWVVDQDFDIVVLANAFDMYLQVPGEHVLAANDGEPDGSTAYVEALHDLVADLEAEGTAVVIVHPIPKPGVTQRARADFRTATGCSVWGVFASRSDLPVGCRDDFDRDAARDRQQIALEAERDAAAGTNATLLDPFDIVCGRDKCEAYQDGMWSYVDYGHITNAYSEAVLEPEFVALLSRALDS